MTERRSLEVIRRGRRWIVAGVVAGLLSSLAYVHLAPRSYAATASVFFSLEYGDSASDLVQGSTYAQDQVASFALLATTPAVLQPVIDEFGLDETPRQLAEVVEAGAPVDTVIVDVTVSNGNAARSADLANAVAASLSRVVEDLAPTDADGDATVKATTVTPAEVPGRPASPDVPLSFVLGLLGGLVLGTAAAYARDRLDTRVRDVGTLAGITDRPAIGTIAVWPRKATSSVVVDAEPHGRHAEAFRQLRTNLEFLAVPAGVEGEAGGARVVMVTSSRPAEGKSTVAANLAVALAETSASVVLVDADLRRPTVARTLQIEGAAGLTTILLGHAGVADVVQDWGASGLQVLTSGVIPPNPAELLGSPAMARLMLELRAAYDYVVVDTPPLLPVADAAVLSRLVDGAVLVVDATATHRDQVAESLRNMAQVNGRVLGIVLNRIRRDDDEAYSYRPTDEPAPRALADTPSRAAATS
jgi:capsular exopolysaccharide synthesis family protein